MQRDNPVPHTSGAPAASEAGRSLRQRLRRALIGSPRSLSDKHLFHRVSLVALLAWVGLGADGLSSSAYGPDEAFRAVGSHTYLLLGLAALTAFTVIVISIAYSRVIEHFPSGGGGYVVATKLLGERVGVVSGCALLVDYVLTIAISIAATGDALASFLPPAWAEWKLSAESLLIGAMIVLNLRGVRESVLVLAPIFVLFVVTHLVLIGGGLIAHGSQLPATLSTAATDFRQGYSTLGGVGMLLLFVHAYSLGGGTYTGIEAVSNGLAIMREPRVRTGKRTMLYMASSLAFTAAGILVLYLLWQVRPEDGKTMNAVLAERIVDVVPLGRTFVVLVLLAEGLLLVVAAQAGFMDGPRVLANMAIDSWVPRRFASLSERLTTQNGVMLMGLSALAALLATRGDVRVLVVMYSINVFLTFSMTELSMCKLWIGERRTRRDWKKKIIIHVVGLSMCLTILGVTITQKFAEGGWVTLAITGVLVLVCTLVRRHYTSVSGRLSRAFDGIEKLPASSSVVASAPDPERPVAVVLVGGYNGFGIHTTLNVFRAFPDHFKGLIFVSVGVVDSGRFKGEDSIDRLREDTERALARYVELAHKFGVPATTRCDIGTDAVETAEALCMGVAREYPRAVFFAGQVVFSNETWLSRLLHNQTAYAIQRRLQLSGQNLVILAAKA
ncbi:MAG: amino acid permease [Phycisphaerales bacterium]|jgi:amino acid transporter|nr:amino acid permease [Phycisphaerales bacterium]